MTVRMIWFGIMMQWEQ